MPGSALPARSEETGRPATEAERNLRFNFIALLLHGLFGQTGFRLLQAPTFLPAYLSLLAGNNAAVGIARAVQSFGMFLSPVVSAGMIEHRRYVKKLGILFGALMRLQILFLALTALFIPQSSAVIIVWLVIGVWGFTGGMQMVAFNFLLSKTIPPSRRGRLLGLRNASAGGTLLVVSVLGGFLLNRYGFPQGYGWTFLLAFALTFLGLTAMATIREPASEEPKHPTPLLHRIGEIPGLVRSDPNFGRFLVARLVGTAARGALPFYVIFVGQHFGLSGGRLAGLTIVFTLAQSTSGLHWGLMADRGGFRSVFIAALSTWIGGSLLMLAWPSVPTAYLVFALVGAGLGGFMLASQNMVLEFGSQRERPMRIATTNSLAEALGMLGFLGAGLLADIAPLASVFGISVGLQVIAILQMRRVVEPRHKARPVVTVE